MAAEIQQSIPGVAEVKLIPSGGGVFEVRRGSEVVYSKRNHGRFPEDGEVLNLLRA